VEVAVKAKELLDANKLSAAIAELTQQVKSHPADIRIRTFLFETLCFAGEYDRAEHQLDVVGHQSEKTDIGVEVYRDIFWAEVARRRFFSDGLRPTFLFDPPEHIHLYLDAINRLRENHPSEAKAILERAENLRPKVKGRLGEQTFNSFRDSDDRLVPVLELIVKSSYVWLPLEQIRRVTIAQPKHLRDLLWIPATLEIGDSQPGEVFLPVIYAGSEREDNDQIRLGRLTEWIALGEGLAGGVGQRTFLIDEGERAILEMRDLEFDVVEKSEERG
jgi:type VI secretion system protein ImpE